MAERPDQPAPEGQPARESAASAGPGEPGAPGRPAGAGPERVASPRFGGRWVRRVAIALAVVLALVGLWGVVGKYLLPGFVADTIAEQLAGLTGRPANVERVEIAPYDLLIRIHGLQVGEPVEAEQPTVPEQSTARIGEPAATEGSERSVGNQTPRSYARIQLIEADLSWRTLWRLAPVVDRLIVVRPDLLVARSPDGVYDGADIVERMQSREPDESTDSEPPRFSVANIQLIGGRVRLDDRKLDLTHEAARIGFGVPFVSSLPVDQEIEIVPSLELLLDDAPVRADGHLLAFGDERGGEILLEIDGFDLTRLLPHLPESLPVRLVSAKLGSRLTTSFVAPRSEPARILGRGDAGLGEVEFLQPDDRPLLKLAGVDALGIEFEPMASRLALDRLHVRAPEVEIERRKGEDRFLDPVLRALETSEASAEPQASEVKASNSQTKGSAESSLQTDSPAFAWSVGSIEVEQGRLRFADQAFEPKPLELSLNEWQATVTGLAAPQPSPARIEFGATASDGSRIEASANALVDPLAVDGEAAVRGVPIAHWAWLAGPALKLSVDSGELAASTRFEAGQPEDPSSPLRWKLSEGRVEASSLRALDSDRQVLQIANLAAIGLEVDPASQRITLDAVTLDGGNAKLRRDAQGGLDAAGWWDPGRTAGKPTAAGASASDSAARPDGDWRIAVGSARLSDSEIALDYAPVAGEKFPPVKLSALELEAGEWASDSKSPLAVSLKAAVGDRGRLEASGTVAPDSGAADLKLTVRSLPLPAAQPWLPTDVNAQIRAGELSADGTLRVSTASDGALRGGWQGAVSVADLATRLKRERPVSAVAGEARGAGASDGGAPSGGGRESNRFGGDLLRWKTLRLPALKVALSPFAVDVGDVALDGLQSRLVISPQGRFNLQDLFGNEPADTPADAASAAADAAPHAAPDAAAAGQTTEAVPRADDGPDMLGGDPAPLPPVDPPPKADAPPIRIGTIKLADGNVDFSDFFIKPNYSANLTALDGTIGPMSPGQPGAIDLKGRIDQTGTVEVAGRIDPIGEPLFLDLRADANDIDLPALSPYSAKYVGYGIEKGKLSASVEYRLVAGQLTAQNKIVLDQLTFGEQVDSPDALKLPVLFAVSLLKDRNGVIDVELPISGSLDDPQFSIGGIVLRLVGNLIVKAVTAPFSLIASLVGGSADELSSLPFAAGEAALGKAARDRLDSLAKALTDRPGLKLEIGGRIAQADIDAQRRAALEAQLTRLKRVGNGAKPRRGDAGASLSPDERRELIERAWAASRPKSVSRDERPSIEAMESQLLDNIDVKEGALRELANRRAQAAKDWLAGEGGIEASRLFVTAPKLPGEGEAGVDDGDAAQTKPVDPGNAPRDKESETSAVPAVSAGGTADILGVEMKLGG